MKVLLGFDKPQGQLGKAIAWFTRGIYSHVKAMFLDPSDPAPLSPVYEALWNRGVIVRDYDHDGADRETHWFVVDVPDPVTAQAFALEQVGKGYDHMSILRFITRRAESRKSRGLWFCAELAFQIAAEGGLYLLRTTEAWRISPQHLADSPLLHGPCLILPDRWQHPA